MEPAATTGGETDTTAGESGASTTCSAPIPCAVSPPVVTVTSRKPRAAPAATLSRTVMRVGDSTCVAPTDTPVPPTATVLPLPKLVPEPSSSTSSAVPRGSAAGVAAATVGATAEIARLASAFE